ncbi:MAG: AMP-dependent synthetase [Candidatus Muproteobacteria bacterium RBG_16_60_9]|uniref:AMP-dependent synthetase n=1 Tax=Candidatus Muproteobacteria bacterium RBG_16_60_9 TaxID=1817755 RepID=A0A1F6VDF9_9PROT|nr:MAG: AMP-dependent synthetase [Candidatus Muproteobacteria bacterium RBG_16_60_9]
MPFRSLYPDVSIPETALSSFVLDGAAARGDKPALIDGPTGRTITYAQLPVLVARVAAGLAARGFKKGERFAIYSPNVPEYAIAFHAVASLGGVVTTVNPLYTVAELAKQLNDSQARFLLTVPPFLATAREAAAQSKVEEIFVFGEAEGTTPFAALLAGSASPPTTQINARKDLVALPYSSGTTGLPKGVMLTHYNLVAQLCSLEGVTDAELVTPQDTVLAFLPFFHIYGIVAFLNLSLHQGATVVTMPRFDLEQYLQLVQKYGVTIMHVVPPIALALAKHPIVANFDLSNIRGAFSAAAPLSDTVANALFERVGFRVSQAYGMTEVSGASHLGPTTPDKIKPASGGRLMPNMECKIVNVGSGVEVPASEQGEILVRGPIVMQGYLGQAGATAATIDADGWLRTGDIGYVDADGDFFIVDRTKELIKYKGLQVAPAELEAVLLGNPAIADACVIGVADEEAGEVPKAFVVKKGEINADEVLAWVAARVAPYKKVRSVEFVDQLPKSATGKLLRRVLIERERNAAAAAHSA